MKIQKQFRPAPKFKIQDADAALKPLSSGDKTADQAQTLALTTQIAEQQNMFYADASRKLLIVLQGTDTSGKDGTVNSVFHGVNPQGIKIVNFKAPNAVELGRDYLWRVHRQVPQSGEIGVFNRSHYEDVLITRVHDWIDDKECQRRYAQIRDFERMLTETGTTLIKFFLHISSDEQKKRLQQRVDNPAKHWKFDVQDLAERKHWARYQEVYADAINATDSDTAPWHIIPANSNTHRNLAIASIVLAALQDMKLKFPPAKPELKGLIIK
ncbi:MAG: UDP-galactose-lipid carrier transferase [Herbaspirillum sp.]|jgi:PPK2 family polyphosphate:nucleotide phosphotransferase|nr:UDP-galactose-lipid carrier transferase [Herbaspirillum sp.]